MLVLPFQSAAATLDHVGGKGASLSRMAIAGLPVPPGFYVTTAAYRRFVAANDLQAAIVDAARSAGTGSPAALDEVASRIAALFQAGTIPDEIVEALRRAYAGLGPGDPAVAVRSSATAEDLPGMSFAGQHETYLNMRGETMVLDAVKRCWASLWTARAIGYRARHGIRPEDVSLAVVVQELVPADVAGILFTANPVTGDRGEVILNASWGLGEAIVGGLVTPDHFVVDKRTGELRSQEIADKATMTVRTPDGTREEPVLAFQRGELALTGEQAAELARLGTRIEALYGQPMDVEWAIHDGQICVLQARPITALPEPAPQQTAAAPDWTLPKRDGKYMRASVIELLPDPLSPLFATLGLPAWNRAMGDLLRRMGLEGLMPDQALTTISGYAYYDLSMTAAQQAALVLRMFRTGKFVPGLFRTAKERWEHEARPHYDEVVRRWQAVDLQATQAQKLADGAGDIVEAAAQHYLAIQSGILPAAYNSEALFTLVYDRLVRRPDDPPALTFLLGYDSAPIWGEKSLYDLATWARAEDGLAQVLRDLPAERLAPAFAAKAAPPGVADEVWQSFVQRFAAHLDHFGHAIYDLDFAKPMPADDPAPLFGALKFFLNEQAPSPYTRQAAAVKARERAMAAVLKGRRGLRLALFWRLLRLAQSFAPLREDALADVGLGWVILRRIFRELGRRLAAAGVVGEQDDVFWLMLDELRQAAIALDTGSPVLDHHAAVAERRAAWQLERNATPPVALPVKAGARFLGVDWSGFLPARSGQDSGDTIRGIGASPGHVTGLARVLHGPDEFHQMRQGEILVAKITTPAWTPLFALAAGVVTDVGGPLSHGSIVAREYHIPAVLGTGVATTRLHSGTRVTVDGDVGAVHIAVEAADVASA